MQFTNIAAAYEEYNMPPCHPHAVWDKGALRILGNRKSDDSQGQCSKDVDNSIPTTVRRNTGGEIRWSATKCSVSPEIFREKHLSKDEKCKEANVFSTVTTLTS